MPRGAGPRAAMRAEIGGPDLWILQQFGSAAFQGDPTGLQDEGPIRDLQGLVCHLLDQQDRQASLPQGDNRLEDVLDDDGREPERGFVEQQQPGLAHQRAPDRKHLLLAAGECSRQLLPALLQTGEEFETACEPCPQLGLVKLLVIGTKQQVIANSLVREDLAALGRERHAQPEPLVRRDVGDVFAVDQDPSADEGLKSNDALEQRALARPVRADDGDYLAGTHMDRGPAHGLDGAVGDLYVFQSEHVPFLPQATASASAPR